MNQDHKEEIYSEGYRAFNDDSSELTNPYSGIDAEYWCDGWEDAKEDEEQNQKNHSYNPLVNQGNETAKFKLTESEEKELQSLEDAGFSSKLTEEQEKNWEDWVKNRVEDDTPRFEFTSNGSPISIDLLTLLQCLKVAEHTHYVPPIDETWWVKIIKQYPVNIHLEEVLEISECNSNAH